MKRLATAAAVLLACGAALAQTWNPPSGIPGDIANRDISAAKEASHIFAARPASLISFTVSSDSDQWILVMDSATVPANGAVTLLLPPIHVAANSTTMVALPLAPLGAKNGISVCNSNANSFTKTIGTATCIFQAQFL